jgi:plasmid stabilization system protein ParE
MAKVEWAITAIEDTQRIAEFIELQNPTAAVKFAQRIKSTAQRLSDLPTLGRVVPELSDPGYREVILPPCRIIYIVEEDVVTIVHVKRVEQLFLYSDYVLEDEEEYTP